MTRAPTRSTLWPAPSRRALLRLAGAAAVGLALPHRARAAITPSQRRFLFIFCEGGWDQTRVFHAPQDTPSLAVEPGSAVVTAEGLRFVDHPGRPAVRRMLVDNADRVSLLHGFEVPSIAHSRCQKLVTTGAAEGVADDWAAILGGEAAGAPLLPTLVASGPSTTDRHTSRVVRLGETGQLSGVISGAALGNSDQPVRAPPGGVQDAVDAHIRARFRAEAAVADPFRARQAAAAADALSDLSDLQRVSGDLDLRIDPSVHVPTQVRPVLDALELGLSRVGCIRHRGLDHMGWDSHADNAALQTAHFETLFSDLEAILAELDARPGPAGGRLSDEVTVVVFSEMGRTPRDNATGGRDHWTFTSAMLVGGGIAGGRMAGGYDDLGVGRPTDLASGQPHGAGVRLTAAHLGATLLALGGVDPGAYLPAVDPVSWLA